VADFSARQYNESDNDIVRNQHWILSFVVDVRKKGKNPDSYSVVAHIYVRRPPMPEPTDDGKRPDRKM